MSAWDWERLRQWDPCKNRDSQILASMTDSDVTSTGQAVPPHNVSQVNLGGYLRLPISRHRLGNCWQYRCMLTLNYSGSCRFSIVVYSGGGLDLPQEAFRPHSACSLIDRNDAPSYRLAPSPP